MLCKLHINSTLEPPVRWHQTKQTKLRPRLERFYASLRSCDYQWIPKW